MICKSMGGKGGDYGGLLAYMTREKAVMKDKNGRPILITHNVSGTLREIEKQFKDNEALRAYRNKTSNKLYHTVLAWSPKDTANLTIPKIQAMTEEFIRLRNENALYVATVHQDKGHIHVHLCISGTEAFSGKSLNITKAEFRDMKMQLEAFQQEKYPELVHSVVDHSKASYERKAEKEMQFELRTGQPSWKEEVKAILEECYQASLSRNDFFEKVKERGLETYERGGKIAGIADERHMRFSTLGYDETKLLELDKSQQRLQELHTEEIEPEQKERSERLNEFKQSNEEIENKGNGIEDIER